MLIRKRTRRFLKNKTSRKKLAFIKFNKLESERKHREEQHRIAVQMQEADRQRWIEAAVSVAVDRLNFNWAKEGF